MIHIEDKLKRTNVYIKRDNVEVDYLTQKEFEGEIDKANAKIKGIYSRINNYATEEDFNKEVEKLNGEIETINTIIADSNEAYQNGYNVGKENGVNEQKNRLSPISITENGTYTNENGYNEVTVNVEMLPTDGGYDKGFADGQQATKDKMLAIQITENGTYSNENGYKSVNVDVKQGGGGNVNFEQIGYDNDESEYAMGTINKDIAYSKSIYDAWNPERTSAEGYFRNYTELVYCPKIDTSKVMSMRNFFYNCQNLVSIPLLNTSKVEDMGNLFYNCNSLKTIPQLDTSNATDVGGMFLGCDLLESVQLLDFGKVVRIDSFFSSKLGGDTVPFVTNLGGFKNLKVNWNDNGGLAKLPNLTYQSIQNVINNLYDFRSNGNSSTTRTLQIHPNTMALLSDEDKALATNKGWVLIS